MGSTIDAELASSWGLVDQVSPSYETLFSNVLKTALKIVDNAPLAMKTQKRLINYWEENDLVSGIRASVDAFAATFENGSAEPKEYMNRFFTRKKAAKEEYQARQQSSEGLDPGVSSEAKEPRN